MIAPEKSLFAGGPIPPSLTAAQEKRKIARDDKWRAVSELRSGMSQAEKDDEEVRLLAEIDAILEARNAAD